MSKTLDSFDSKKVLSALLNPADNKVMTQVLLEEAKQIKFSTGSVKGKKAKIQEAILTIEKKIDPINDEHVNIYKQLCTAVEQSADWPISPGWGPASNEQIHINCKFVYLLGEIIDEFNNQISEA